MKRFIERPYRHCPAASSNVTHLIGHPSALDNLIALTAESVRNPLSRHTESIETILDDCDVLVAAFYPPAVLVDPRQTPNRTATILPFHQIRKRATKAGVEQ